VRFRALFNLGLLALHEAMADSAARDSRLADAERAYREALLLRPHDLGAKWNLELAVRRQHGGSSRSNPPSGGGGGAPQSGGGGGSSKGRAQGGAGVQGGMSPAQADEVLRSIGQQELKTRRDRTGQTRRAVEPGVKDW